MLCREKRTGTRVGTSVIAACGECCDCSTLAQCTLPWGLMATVFQASSSTTFWRQCPLTSTLSCSSPVKQAKGVSSGSALTMKTTQDGEGRQMGVGSPHLLFPFQSLNQADYHSKCFVCVVPPPAVTESERPKEFRTQVSLDTDPSLAARGARPAIWC